MAQCMHGVGVTPAHGCCCPGTTQHHHRRSRQQQCQASVQDVAQLVPHISTVANAHLAAPSALQVLADIQPSTAASIPSGPVTAYTPGPVEVGWQIWFAAFVSTVPFVIGAYEFGKRILIQRRCQVCGGSGLVQRGRYQRKCPECGGFFPWISWSMFLSANARPGNGGPLLQPRGQTSVLYKVPPQPTQQQGSGPNTVAEDEAKVVATRAHTPGGEGQDKQQQQH